MDIHSWIDLAAIVGLFASTVGGVVLAHRLAQHQTLQDKINDHESRIGKVETAIEWVQKLFKRE